MLKKKVIMTLAAATIMSSCSNSASNTTSSSETNDEYELVKDFSVDFAPKQALLANCSLISDGLANNGVAIGNFNSSSAYAKYEVDVPISTFYLFEVRYFCDAITNYSLFVNEINKYSLNFSGNSTSYKTSKIMVKLNKGTNSLKIRNTQGQGYLANIDSVSVSGFKSLSSVGLFFEDKDVFSNTTKIGYDCPLGFEYQFVNSSHPEVINLNGEVLDFSQNKEVTLDTKILLGSKNISKKIKINVNKASPSVEEIVNEIFTKENDKEIPSGKTNFDFPSVYKDCELFIKYSSDEGVISRNGVVNAKKDDITVQLKFLVRKLDGTEAVSQEVSYLVKGLGYECDYTFENPLAEGQDPFSTFIDGYYYHIRASGGGLEMTKSTSLLDYKTGGFQRIWTPPSTPGVWNSRDVWGPFPLMKWTDGYYYIYYAADDGINNNHREGVLKSKEKTPLCEYEDLGMVNTSDLEYDENPNPTLKSTRWAIGTTTYQDEKGDWYLVWSGWRNENDAFPQRSYIAKIVEPAKIGARVEISQPSEDWEGIAEGTPIQEGQAIFTRKGKTFLLYSANSSWAGRYRLGILKYEEKFENGLLNPNNWAKVSEPQFVATESVESPGGPCIVQSPDGNEYWLMYHHSRWNGGGWKRYVSAKPIRFDEEGYPILDDPIPFYTKVRAPSGDDKSYDKWPFTIEAENCETKGNLKTHLSNTCAGGEYVDGFAESDGSLSFKYTAANAGSYKIRVVHSCLTEGSKQILKVNDKEISLDYIYYGQNSFMPYEVQVDLLEGDNVISLSHKSGFDVKIDCFGVSYNG